jgi:hypothetical protein
MSDVYRDFSVRLISIVFVVSILVAVGMGVFGGWELASFIYVWVFIGIQVLAVIHGIGVFWAGYSCSVTNKGVFAAFAVASAAICVRLGFYLLELLRTETYFASTIFFLTFVLGMVDTTASLLAKRFLLNVPLPSVRKGIFN